MSRWRVRQRSSGAKNPDHWIGVSVLRLKKRLGFYDVGGFGSFFRIDDFELDCISFRKGFEAFPFDGGKMHKHISRTVFLGDKTISFLIVKPLYFAAHFDSPRIGASHSFIR